MKLLVFAHIPPPYHGQSYAIQSLLSNFGGDCRKQKQTSPDPFGIECYHVNARFSKGIKDVGKFQGGKFFRMLSCCLQAIWCRFRYGVKNFYYVPAPGKRTALYRDWVIMLLCRPFFKKIIFHWHAAGLAEWLESATSPPARHFTYWLMKNPDLSIVLSEFNRRDAEKFQSRRTIVVPAGVTDSCPQFEQIILPRRHAQADALEKIFAGRPISTDGQTVHVLYLAHCTREKGVFDTVEGIALANKKLAGAKSPLRFRLTLVGAFVSSAEEKELQELIRRHGLQDTVKCLGFVSEERKIQAFTEADLFCFPTYYHAESFGAVLIEAMAFGLPIITTRWRSIPEIFPPDYPGFVESKSPEQIADMLPRLAAMNLAEVLRKRFLDHYTFERNLANIAEAIRSLETAP